MKKYEDVILQEIADHLVTLPKTHSTFTIQLASLDAFAVQLVTNVVHIVQALYSNILQKQEKNL